MSAAPRPARHAPPDESAREREPAGPSGVLIAVLAVATGVLVANLYYAQPLIAAIGPALGISPALAGSVLRWMNVSL